MSLELFAPMLPGSISFGPPGHYGRDFEIQGGKAAQEPRPPVAGLPEFGTLVYTEKLLLVVLTAAAVVYLLSRSAQVGPLRGIEETKRKGRL